MAPKNILITGSTAHQGLAVINALLSPSSSSTEEFHIYALTRNLLSPASQNLLKLYENRNITLIQGSTLDPQAIFAQLPPIHGIFLVTHPDTTEKKQGEGMIDIAIEKEVKQFIFSSADRGRDEEGGTGIGHFETKRRLEGYLKDACSKSNSGENEEEGMTYTILKPTSFMENLTPTFQGKILATLFSQLPEYKKVALISVRDIGRVAAMAFCYSEKYGGRSITLAGEFLTFTEMERIFEREVGKKLERSYGVLGSALKWGIGDLGDTMRWMGEKGYVGVDEELKLELRLVGFGEWVREYSAFVIRNGGGG